MIKIISKSKITVKEIKETEDKLDSSFSKSYKDFLLKSNGGRPESNIISLSNNQIGVRNFFGIGLESGDNLVDVFRIYKKRIPINSIPIAEDDCGNLIILDKNNKVWFWDHEKEDSKSGLTLIAKDFNKFLMLIKPFNLSRVKLRKKDIIEAWIDPEFLKKIKGQQKNEKG